MAYSSSFPMRHYIREGGVSVWGDLQESLHTIGSREPMKSELVSEARLKQLSAINVGFFHLLAYGLAKKYPLLTI